MSYLAPRRRGPGALQIVLLFGGGLAFGLAAAFLFLAPRIVSVSPAAGARAGAFAAVEVRFSVPMGSDCAAGHFSVDPPVAGDLAVRGDTLRFEPSAPWPPNTAVAVTIRSGACSAGGLPLLVGKSWSFTPSLVRVAYIPIDAKNTLMAVPAGGGGPEILAALDDPVQSYDLSARGDFAVFAAGSARPGGLWLSTLAGAPAELLLDCGADICRDPVISPDGRSVAFVRRRLAAGETLPPAVELLSLADRSQRPVSSAGDSAEHPTWTAQGWLSWYDGLRQAIVVDDLAGGRTFIPDSTGLPWTWRPDGSAVVFPETLVQPGDETLTEVGSRLYSHLIAVAPQTNDRADLTGAEVIDDTLPAFSPDGSRLVFSRSFFDSRWTPGRQLWVMDWGDRSIRRLTNSPDYSHSAIRWSPDGTRIVCMLFHETSPSDPPEIWILNADGSDPRRLAVGGFLPQWLP